MGLFYNDDFNDNFSNYNSQNQGSLLNNLNSSSGLDYLTKGLNLVNNINNSRQDGISGVLQTLLGTGTNPLLGNRIGGFLGGGSSKGSRLTMAALTMAPDLIRTFAGGKQKDLERQNQILENRAQQAEQNSLRLTQALDKMEDRLRQVETKAIEASATTNVMMMMSNRVMERENSNLEKQIQQVTQQGTELLQTKTEETQTTSVPTVTDNIDTSTLTDDTGTTEAVVEQKKPEKTSNSTKKTKSKAKKGKSR